MTSRNEEVAVTKELTPKELGFLRLLATRLSRRESSQRLYVSLNTVETRQRALYRSLGVQDRSAAVKRARGARPAVVRLPASAGAGARPESSCASSA